MTNTEAMKAMYAGKCVRYWLWPQGMHIAPDFRLHLSPSDRWGEAWSVEEHLARSVCGWYIYQPEESGHDWAWACEQMLAGKKVRRKLWIAGHWYQLQLGLKSAGCYRELYEPGPGPSRDCAGLHVICDRRATVSEADFKATDWVLADEGVKP